MTAQEREHLARFETFDGDRWHVLTDERLTHAEPEHVVAECSAHAPREAFTDEAPPGEEPDDLTGNTICYGCIHARREKEGPDHE